MRSLGDERGVLLSWLVKLLVGLAVAAIVLYDSGSVIVNYFGLDSAARAVATAVSSGVGSGALATPLAVHQAAATAARKDEAKLVAAHVDAHDVIHVRLRRTAHTLLVQRLAPISQWGKATATARSRAP